MATVETWMQGTSDPSGPYELLGLRRFCPDRTEVKSAIRDAVRELSQYQMHDDPAVARRAAFLLSEAGKADAIWSSENALLEFHVSLFESLRGTVNEQQRSRHDIDGVAAWLVTEQLIDRRTALPLAQAILGVITDSASIVRNLLGLASQQHGASGVETHGGSLLQTSERPKAPPVTSRDVGAHGSGTSVFARKRPVPATAAKRNPPVIENDAPLVPLASVDESPAERIQLPWPWIIAGGVIVTFLVVDLLWVVGVFDGFDR